QPDLAILAVNTFVKDSQDPNPLIRALAVRTMGCIRVDKITEYLCDPLQRCLKDDDPYVRKTAAICVAKLYDINAELVEDRGFLEALKDLISDNNPMVVANAVAALAEIQDSSARPIFEITSHTLSKLLTALNEAQNNPLQMELITSTDVVRNLCLQYSHMKLRSSFASIMTRYMLRWKSVEIMIKLASDRNIDQVLLEFKEYATEVDVDFVRKAVRAIGRCAIKLERAAERSAFYILYESIIATLCESLDTLDEPEAKASMIWIIGEYAERIDNADELLESFLETFPEEPALVQLQLLTATVKLFLKKPTEGPQQMIQAVLNNATVETDNPDLRDRAYIYWRLLSTDPEAAKDVVLAEKPVISDDSNQLDSSLLDDLLANILPFHQFITSLQKHLSAVLRRLLRLMMRNLLIQLKQDIQGHHLRELMGHHLPLVLALLHMYQ
ncbi:hypothetical protein GUJ93_ZPchr0995g22923, partial [Zizania palustris]